LTPNAAVAGGAALTLTVDGAGFTSSFRVHWNTTELTTTLVSAARLTAAVPASLLASAGTASVTAVNGDSATNSLLFTITTPPSLSSLTISPATLSFRYRVGASSPPP